MAELQPGLLYRLIGGDRVRVDGHDAAAGIVTVTDAEGRTQRLTESAFAGATAEPAEPSAESGDTWQESAAPDPDRGFGEPPDPPPSDQPSQEQTMTVALEDAAPEQEDGRPSNGEIVSHDAGDGIVRAPAEPPDADDPDGDAAAPDAATQGRAAPASSRVAEVEPGETREFDFEPHEEEPLEMGSPSPLALGLLLGMLMLAGVAGWLVQQSRLDNLEAQFHQLDERLQVVVGDVRRQGESLRTYLTDPRVPVSAVAQGRTTEQLAELESQLAEQRALVAALEKRVANQDGALAELDRRAGQLEKQPLASPAAPRRPPSVAVAEAAEPPVGYVVVLASLPERPLALQEIDALRAKGLSVVLREARINNATWYRVQAEGFRDRESASAFARLAESRHGVVGAWVVAP